MRRDHLIFSTLGLHAITRLLGQERAVPTVSALSTEAVRQVADALRAGRHSGSDEEGLGLDLASALLLAESSHTVPDGDAMWADLALRARDGQMVSALGGVRVVAESGGPWRDRARALLWSLPLTDIPLPHLRSLLETEWMYTNDAWRHVVIGAAWHQPEIATRAMMGRLRPSELVRLFALMPPDTHSETVMGALEALAKSGSMHITPAALAPVLEHRDGAVRERAMLLLALGGPARGRGVR